MACFWCGAADAPVFAAAVDGAAAGGLCGACFRSETTILWFVGAAAGRHPRGRLAFRYAPEPPGPPRAARALERLYGEFAAALQGVARADPAE